MSASPVYIIVNSIHVCVFVCVFCECAHEKQGMEPSNVLEHYYILLSPWVHRALRAGGMRFQPTAIQLHLSAAPPPPARRSSCQVVRMRARSEPMYGPRSSISGILQDANDQVCGIDLFFLVRPLTCVVSHIAMLSTPLVKYIRQVYLYSHY